MFELLLQSIREKVNLSTIEEEGLRKFFIPKKYRKRQYLLNAGDSNAFTASCFLAVVLL